MCSAAREVVFPALEDAFSFGSDLAPQFFLLPRVIVGLGREVVLNPIARKVHVAAIQLQAVFLAIEPLARDAPDGSLVRRFESAYSVEVCEIGLPLGKGRPRTLREGDELIQAPLIFRRQGSLLKVGVYRETFQPVAYAREEAPAVFGIEAVRPLVEG